METWPPVAAAGLLLLAGAAYLLLDVLLHAEGEAAIGRAKEAAFLRPSLAARRRHNRALMKVGYVSALLSAGAALFWIAIVTNGRSDNEADARMFAWIALCLAALAVVLMTSWWRISGRKAGGYRPRS